MNLRTLKKLSKRAAPLLPLLGDARDQFRAEPSENYIATLIADRKHWERSPCHASYEPWGSYASRRGAPMKRVTRAGRHLVLRPPVHPRKGTVMVGAMSGYYEPEWSEETAWEALAGYVEVEFTDWSVERPVRTRRLDRPSDYLRAAADLIAQSSSQCLSAGAGHGTASTKADSGRPSNPEQIL